MAMAVVRWVVYKAGWKVCCWKVCWWQLAMAGLCGVVEWVTVVGCMAHVQCVQHKVWYTMFLHNDALNCCFRLWEYLRRVTCHVFEKKILVFFFLLVFFWWLTSGFS